jgi:hypothetical protein
VLHGMEVTLGIKRTSASCLVGMALLVASASPAAAQAGGSTTSGAPAPELGLTTGILHYGGFGSYLGFDANYSTTTFTQPATSLGVRAGVVVEGGVHKFNGDTLELVQGGVNLRADKLNYKHIEWYGRVMFGYGHFSFSNDTLFTLDIGADFPLQGKPFKIRGDVADVWDFFSGGHQVAWRYSIGIALPLK